MFLKLSALSMAAVAASGCSLCYISLVFDMVHERFQLTCSGMNSVNCVASSVAITWQQ